MTVENFLMQNTARLATAGIESARLDVILLLEDELRVDRSTILAHPEQKISPKQLAQLEKNITKRQGHYPLTYIRGRCEFYGREFLVDDSTLVPRPESEAIIELLLGLPTETLTNAKIVDVGTGSGCLGITAQLELPNCQTTLIDNSPQALTIAQKNAEKLKTDVTILQNDLLTGVQENFNIVMANLPYVPTSFQINPAARHEPPNAIFSGSDGMAHYRALWQQLSSTATQFVITESLINQHQAQQELARQAGFKLLKNQGLAQLFNKIN